MKKIWQNSWVNCKKKVLKPYLRMESLYLNSLDRKKVTLGKSKSKSMNWITLSLCKMSTRWIHKVLMPITGLLTTPASSSSRLRRISWNKKRHKSPWLYKSWKSMRLSLCNSSRKNRLLRKINMWKNITQCRSSYRRETRRIMEVEMCWM